MKKINTQSIICPKNNQMEIIRLESDSEDKNYLFTKNTMFNVFLNGKIISYTNIDDNNQVHILDNYREM